jgi:hypothetical protein
LKCGKGIYLKIKVNISKIRNIIYFDYVSYHPFVKTLRQYKKNKNLKYKDSELYKYYHKFNPQNLSQSMFETNEIKSLNKFTKMHMCHPWEKNIYKMKPEKGLLEADGCQHFGKVSYRKGLLEFKRLITLYKKIKAKGYKKNKYVSGYLLKRYNDYRIVLVSGNHRMAVMAALRYKIIKMKIINAIDINDIHNWTMVQTGLLKENEARKMFERYFCDNGKNKLERINVMNNKKMYQPEASIKKWELISKHLDDNDKTLLDIGCNAGYLVKKALQKGMKANGIEGNKDYISKDMEAHIKNNIVTPENIRYIRRYDAILLLSVNQQFNSKYGADIERKMIKIIGNKANKKFFFQPASIKSKYKDAPNIKDNDGDSIKAYNIKLLKELFPHDIVKYVGQTKLTTKKEPYRYIFLVEKKR